MNAGPTSEQIALENAEVESYLRGEVDAIVRSERPSLQDLAFALMRVARVQGSQQSYSGLEIAAEILRIQNELRKQSESGVITTDNVRDAFSEITRAASIREFCIDIAIQEISNGFEEPGLFQKIVNAPTLKDLINVLPQTQVMNNRLESFDAASARKQLENLYQDLVALQSKGETGVMLATEVRELVQRCMAGLPQSGEMAAALQYSVRRLTGTVED